MFFGVLGLNPVTKGFARFIVPYFLKQSSLGTLEKIYKINIH